MGKYGECAVRAAEIAVQRSIDPKAAWVEAAVRQFPHSASSRNKGCPKGAFLGLCEEGLVKGIAKGAYTRSTDNKGYSVTAAALLKDKPELAANKDTLWRLIPDHPLNENNQMDVVISLWQKKLIE
ncbi:MAG TPA: hypothetical protein VHW90_01505 [Stellaceae bacterium]|jgi:hypothetical protein|nr:hypothetical protein [Stellaceae bacterium]